MTNTLKLKSLMIAQGYTNESLANAMQISKQSLSMKLNNKREFKVNEIQRLCKILNLYNANELISIFFVSKSELNSTRS